MLLLTRFSHLFWTTQSTTPYINTEGTPFHRGHFRLKLVLPQEYPSTPPRGFFLTKIYHPNVADNGDICVNTLKKDWTTEVTLKHIFQVIRCLLIVPFPESSLNGEAGKEIKTFL
jgi:ubiquitin-conjugating enzyme E2 S